MSWSIDIRQLQNLILLHGHEFIYNRLTDQS